MLIQHKEDYRLVRAKGYPKISDQIDAIMKMASALKDQGITLPEDTLAWITECQSIKAKYPKS